MTDSFKPERRMSSHEADYGLEMVDALDEDAARMPISEGARLQDLPMQLIFHRLWETTERHAPERRIDSQAFRGWTTEMDCYGFGVKVYVRILLDGNLSVIIEDSEGRTNVAEYEREPLRRAADTGETT